jgi:hypothetical protein
MLCNFGVISKTAQLKVENSAKTTSKFSPVSYHAPRSDWQLFSFRLLRLIYANIIKLFTDVIYAFS